MFFKFTTSAGLGIMRYETSKPPIYFLVTFIIAHPLKPPFQGSTVTNTCPSSIALAKFSVYSSSSFDDLATFTKTIVSSMRSTFISNPFPTGVLRGVYAVLRCLRFFPVSLILRQLLGLRTFVIPSRPYPLDVVPIKFSFLKGVKIIQASLCINQSSQHLVHNKFLRSFHRSHKL